MKKTLDQSLKDATDLAKTDQSKAKKLIIALGNELEAEPSLYTPVIKKTKDEDGVMTVEWDLCEGNTVLVPNLVTTGKADEIDSSIKEVTDNYVRSI